MNESHEITTTQEPHAMTLSNILRHVELVEHVLNKVMKPEVHYGGSFPGDTKKNLLKPGADKLCLAFQLSPTYEVDERALSGDHREYRVTCKLSTPQGRAVGEGVGTCSTMESKYRWRNSSRKCPKCGKETIIKGKEEYGGGWLCFPKKGGCGSKWTDGAKEIESQDGGKVENTDIADVFNTCLKMGKKRAYVDATITATAASDLFTQDIEDLQQSAVEEEKKELERKPEERREAPKAQATTTAASKSVDSRPSSINNATVERHSPGAGFNPAEPKTSCEQLYRPLIKLEGETFAKAVWKNSSDWEVRYRTLFDVLTACEAIRKAIGNGRGSELIGSIINGFTMDLEGMQSIRKELVRASLGEVSATEGAKS